MRSNSSQEQERLRKIYREAGLGDMISGGDKAVLQRDRFVSRFKVERKAKTTERESYRPLITLTEDSK